MFWSAASLGVKARRLVDVTYEALMRGHRAAKPGTTLGDIGAAIQTHAEAQRYSVVRDFCGHGLGRVFHDAPERSCTTASPGRPGAVLKPGMFFTIEPMINLGKPAREDPRRRLDRGHPRPQLSAQFEHTVGITEDGCEIFTLSPAGLHHPEW